MLHFLLLLTVTLGGIYARADTQGPRQGPCAIAWASLSSDPVAFMKRLKGVPPRFAELVERGIFKRYWNHPKVLEMAALFDPAVPETRAIDFGEELSVEVRAALNGDKLDLYVPLIRVESRGFGSRVKGLDTEFLKVLTAVLRAAERLSFSNPEITRISFIAENIINPQLYAFLYKRGMEPMETHVKWQSNLILNLDLAPRDPQN